ncbi:DUF2634 domain-containing protein [Clostridiaceae bacterium M8S5]|nr:DUF2634 domain-containing protein [Clostridiaceae bacterium M8S5]
MLPKIAELKFKTNEQKEMDMRGRSFLFDFEKGEFVLRNGNTVLADEIESIQIWIEKVLLTEKYKYNIYKRDDGKEYGVMLQDLIIGTNYPRAFVEAEIRREIKNELTKHPRILSISNFSIDKRNPELYVSFKVNLVSGNNFDKKMII